MTEPARLTSDLLARKGQAFPTDGLAWPTIDLSQPLPDKLSPRRGSLALVSGAPERQSARPRQARADNSGRRDHGRVALTLRLDRERHRRLRIFAASHERTSQEVILSALDAYLAARGVDGARRRRESGPRARS
jgi:hypothetical protein